MHPEAARLIELTTRPLAGNAELLMAAKAEMENALETRAAEAITEAADALARADLYPQRRRWQVALVVLTVMVSVPLLVHSALQFRELLKLGPVFSMMSGGMGSRPVSNFTPQQRLLLFGAEGAATDSAKWKPLWDSEPENPAYLTEYATAYFSQHNELSPEILEAAERVDPDNAWFQILAAAGRAEGAVSKERAPSSGRKAAPKTPVWKIDDEKRLLEALALIHGITGKSRMTFYQDVMLQQRLTLFPPRRDFVSQIPRTVYAASQTAPGIRLRKLVDVLAAGAQRCAAAGDVAGFRQIVGDWRILSGFSVRNSYLLIDGLIARVVIGGPLQNFRDAARGLGLEQEADEFEALYARLQKEKDDREDRTKVDGMGESIQRQGSILTSMVTPMVRRQVMNPPPLTEADLKPGRYADHAMLERLFAWTAWLLLGGCVGLAALSRFRHNPLAWGLSARIQDLIRPSDWLWMVGGGLVFPLVWYGVFTRLTPLSAHEWNARMSVFIMPGGQFGGLLLSIIILPVLIASRCLAKRGAVLGLAPRFSWLGWTAAAAALAGVPAYGALMWIGPTAGLVLSGVAVAWLLAGFAVVLFGRGSQALRRASLARIVPTVWICGMLMLAASSLYFYSQERRWIQQDRIFAPNPFQYESEVAQVLRAELLEIIGEPADAR
jgi:hypothetical protein